MKYLIIAIILIGLLLTGFLMIRPDTVAELKDQALDKGHIYASWDTMEFDKCVAAWLIIRFIDADAKFVFHPKGTEITKGTLFDVPGANWSRQHRKCTSQCILESMDNADAAIEEIISIAGKVELNFWQLDSWPEAQKCFYEVKQIMDQTPDPLECFEKTRVYFDRMYSDLKEKKEK